MSPGPTGSRPSLPVLARRARSGATSAFRAARSRSSGARSGVDRARNHVRDILAPVTHVGRGARHQARWVRAWWMGAPLDKRKGALAGACLAVILMYFVPLVLLGAAVAFLAGSVWFGRHRAPSPPPGPDPADLRLQAVYQALVPYLGDEKDPALLFRADGSYKQAFENWRFDGDRLEHLELRYSPFFPDGDPAARAGIERVLEAKAGRFREYLFDWDTEHNHLSVTALGPLPGPVRAQPYVTAPCEIVLGFTDPSSSDRLIPVRSDGDGPSELPPVVWRSGIRTTEPHLLAVAGTGGGKSTFLRTVALQALRDGDVVVVDGAGSGDFACLAGRRGVLRVESGPQGAAEALTWVRQETERRVTAVARAKLAGLPVPEDARRPLWVLLDEITELSEAAAAQGLADPQELLDGPLRLGRGAHVGVVATAHPSHLGRLHRGLLAEARVRVALGRLDAAVLETALGTAPRVTGGEAMPAGRGHVRVGDQPVVRIRTPYTPDPLEDDTAEADRRAVLALLPRMADDSDAPALPPGKTPPLLEKPPLLDLPALLDRHNAALRANGERARAMPPADPAPANG